jgi:hypothetical protein
MSYTASELLMYLKGHTPSSPFPKWEDSCPKRRKLEDGVAWTHGWLGTSVSLLTPNYFEVGDCSGMGSITGGEERQASQTYQTAYQSLMQELQKEWRARWNPWFIGKRVVIEKL